MQTHRSIGEEATLLFSQIAQVLKKDLYIHILALGSFVGLLYWMAGYEVGNAAPAVAPILVALFAYSLGALPLMAYASPHLKRVRQARKAGQLGPIKFTAEERAWGEQSFRALFLSMGVIAISGLLTAVAVLLFMLEATVNSQHGIMPEYAALPLSIPGTFFACIGVSIAFRVLFLIPDPVTPKGALA